MTREFSPDEIDFAELVRPGDTVLWTQGAGEPLTLIERLLAQRHRIGPFRVFLGSSFSGVVRPEHADIIAFVGLGAVGSTRAMSNAGVLDIVPCHLSDMPRMLANGALRVDVVLMQLSPEDDQGRLSMGPVNSYVQAALARARLVVGEVNDQSPWTYARDPVDKAQIHLLTRTSRPLVEIPSRPVGDTDRAIANHITGFIHDGAVLQVGIGTIPNAVFDELRGHRDLGLHTGVIGDGVIDLIRTGVITNATKRLDRGKSVTGALMGTRALYDFAHRNPDLLVEPVVHTHDQAVLAQVDRLVAVNSAIEVDLTGQIAAEIAKGAYVGTVGGQTDFVRGAFASRCGRSIIGLPSRTDSGKARIVPQIVSSPITTARADADVVVTEFGSAELRYQHIRERVRRMIAIAHPADRDALERAARETVAGY